MSDTAPTMRVWTPVIVAAVVAFAAACIAALNALSPHLKEIATGEQQNEAADKRWERAFANEDEGALRNALQGYERVLRLSVLQPEDGLDGLTLGFARWLARPLRLRCLRRIAAARELLRDDMELIVRAHAAVIREGYCEAVEEDIGVALSEWHPARDFASCQAPHARGMILFAPSPADAEAAFEAALLWTRPSDGSRALTWTTRWQLPDRHVSGLRASAWWPSHPAVAMLEAAFPTIVAEYEQLLESQPSVADGQATFGRRRSDAWIAAPREGWGMVPLVPVPPRELPRERMGAGSGADSPDASSSCVAKSTCDLVGSLQRGTRPAHAASLGTQTSASHIEAYNVNDRREPSPSVSGSGYYILKPGTRLHPHAGPTNARLTCHLTLRGEGAWFTVGGEPPREWQPGRAFCFDDSFVHEAVHKGSSDRVVLLVDVPHPDLGADELTPFESHGSGP